MTFNPLSDVIDAPLALNESAIDQLRLVPQVHQFDDLPGEGRSSEQSRLKALLRELIDILILGIEKHCTKLWVMRQFQIVLEHVEQEDTEARERFGAALENVMETLGIESSDGLLAAYLGGI